MIRNLLGAVALIALAGCASQVFVPGVSGADGIRITQQITVSSGVHEQTLLGVLEMHRDHTALAVLGPAGLVLFSVEQTDRGITIDRHADLPNFVDPREILRDVQLVNWPGSTLAQLWGSRVKLDHEGFHRSIHHGDETIKTVRYQPIRQGWQKAILIDQQKGYQIQVNTVSKAEI